MKNAKALWFVFALTLATVPCLWAADRMVTGNWTFEMETTGQDSRTFTRCISADEAQSVNGDTAAARAYAEKAAGANCAVKDFAVDGDTVSYRLVCGETTIASKATYHGETFEGVMTTKSGDVEATTHLKAHRTGACP
jgi:Protein of unknown function (DUF3617)